MPNWYLGAVLVTAPFFIKLAPQIVTYGSWSFYLKCVALLSACLFGIQVTKRIKIAALLAFGVAFTASNPFAEMAWYQFDYVFCSLILFASMRNLNERTINTSLAIVCILSCAWLWLEKFGIDPAFLWLSSITEIKREILKPGSYVVNGSLGHINHTGALVASTMFFLRKKFWAIPLLTLAVFASSLPIFCVLVGIVFYMFLNNKKVIYALFAVIFILALVSLYSGYSALGTNGRVEAWKAYFDWGANFWGHGYGVIGDKFAQVYKSVSGERFHRLHNDLLEVFAIGGVAWVAGFFYMMKPIFTHKENRPALTCCFVLLINSLGNFTFQIAPLLITFLACYTLITKGEKNGSINN